MTAASARPEELLERIRAEYREIPGLRVTLAQGSRLWGIDPATCERLLETLVSTRFLFRARDGSFIRLENVLRRQP